MSVEVVMTVILSAINAIVSSYHYFIGLIVKICSFQMSREYIYIKLMPGGLQNQLLQYLDATKNKTRKCVLYVLFSFLILVFIGIFLESNFFCSQFTQFIL